MVFIVVRMECISLGNSRHSSQDCSSRSTPLSMFLHFNLKKLVSSNSLHDEFEGFEIDKLMLFGKTFWVLFSHMFAKPRLEAIGDANMKWYDTLVRI